MAELIQTNKRVVVLISGSGSNLQAFIEQEKTGELGGKIVAVISNIANVYGLERAKAANIEAKTLPHKDFSNREDFDIALAKAINSYDPDLIILAGFMRILTPNFVNQFAGKLLNIHPSLLPKYPGLHTHQKALDNQDKYHGTSVHFVTEELDGGPVVAQSRLSLTSKMSVSELQSNIQTLEHKLYPNVASWFLTERLCLKDNIIYFDNNPLESPIIYG